MHFMPSFVKNKVVYAYIDMSALVCALIFLLFVFTML